MQKSIKRTMIFVSREIQGRILRRMVKYWFLYNFAVWHGLLLIDLERYGVPTLLSGGPGLSLYEFYAEFAAQHVILLALAAGLSPFLLWDMLKLTHQIAGPLVRFRNSLQQMASGEPVARIKLRDGDLLGEFQEAFNRFLESDRLIVGERPRSSSRSHVDSQTEVLLTTPGDEMSDTQTSNRDSNCRHCRTGPQTYSYLKERYVLDVDLARQIVLDGREPVEIDNESLLRDLKSTRIYREHLPHVDVQYPGIIAHLFFPLPDGTEEHGHALIDGNHRAVRCQELGRPFYAYLLTEDESRQILLRSPQRQAAAELQTV